MTNLERVRMIRDINLTLTCFVEDHFSEFKRSDYKKLKKLLFEQRFTCNNLISEIL